MPGPPTGGNRPAIARRLLSVLVAGALLLGIVVLGVVLLSGDRTPAPSGRAPAVTSPGRAPPLPSTTPRPFPTTAGGDASPVPPPPLDDDEPEPDDFRDPTATGPDGTRPSGPPGVEPPSADLLRFLEECAAGVRDWRSGQVSYPPSLTLHSAETVTYVAAVDVRAAPVPPSALVPGPSPTGEPVFVRCDIEARLVPLGSALVVDEEGWLSRRFTPTGVIRWSWAVTAVGFEPEDLRLDLRPVARAGEGSVALASGPAEVSSFFTTAVIEEALLEKARRWWDAHWTTLAVIAGGLGAAVLALLRYSEQFARRWASARAAWRGAAAAPPGEDDPAPTATTVEEDDAAPTAEKER